MRAKLEEGLRAADPLERAAAVRGLAPLPESRALIRQRLGDPVRLVRLEVAWTLSAELTPGSPVRAEFDAYLRLRLDQPTGLARIGADLANRGRLDEARQTVERASRWDGGNADLHLVTARLLLAQGKTGESAERYLQAAENRPNDDASAYDAALGFAEAGRDQEAEMAFELCLRRDPSRHRAWYNLGLLLARKERLSEALAALARAEKLAPSVADYPYAAATVHLRLGDRTAAQEEASRARSLRPDAAAPTSRAAPEP